MSSLYSLLRKGKRLFPELLDNITETEWRDLNNGCLANAAMPNCILVNAQSVAGEMVEKRLVPGNRLDKIPLITPPFRNMWVEFAYEPVRYAVQVGRIDKPEGCFIQLIHWVGKDGCIAGPVYVENFLLDDDGYARNDTVLGWWISRVTEEREGDIQARHLLATACTLCSLSRMNCKNVELRPMNEGKFRPPAPNKVRPASVWHEIVITSVPKIRSGGRDVFEKEEREIRAHWIRGHYADYRKGKGLFGNPKLKGLFWIPEHRKGNEELGQVIPEYTIQ